MIRRAKSTVIMAARDFSAHDPDSSWLCRDGSIRALRPVAAWWGRNPPPQFPPDGYWQPPSSPPMMGSEERSMTREMMGEGTVQMVRTGLEIGRAAGRGEG